MNKKGLLQIFLLLSTWLGIQTLQAQDTYHRDSLLSVWKNPLASSSNRMDALHRIIFTYHLPGNRDSVSYYGNQLLRFAQQEQDLKYQGLAYDLLGKNAIRQGRIGEAALLIKSDIAIWKQIGSQADLAEAYNLQGVVFSYLGQLDLALLQYQAALEIRYEMKDSAQASGLLSNMANIYQQTGDMAQSQTYNEKALALALACGDSPYEGNIRYNLANCYQFFRKYAAAMEQHVQAIAIAEAREDFKSTVLSMLSLANVYVAIKEYTKVAAYLEQALALALEKDLYAEQVYAYVRLGDYYFDQKVYEKAQESFSQGLAIAEEQGISYLIYDAKVSLGKLHVFWEELTSAEPYLLPIITSDAETVDIESWVEAHLEMGKLRILQSRWTEALSYASTGFEYAKDAELQVIQSALAKELTRIYRQLGRYEDAIHMYDTHLALRDSLDKDEAIRDILRIEYQADYEKQSLQDSLENVTLMAVEVEKSENRKHLATALAIGLVLALLVGMLLWNRFRLTRHQKVLIETEKAKVDQAYLSLDQEREKLDQANSDLHTANGKLKELDDFKSRFFTNISHEFRTPLTLISGVARQLQENPKKWGREGPQLIERNAARLTHMINQILDLRKLESGNLNLQPIQDDVLPFLQYSIQSFDSLAAERSISLTFETELTDLLMDFDPDKLLQVQTNLLANALKFTPQGGRVVVHVNRSPDQRLMLQVQDTGRGIPPNKLSLIFDRFYQVNSHDISEGEGTGIGLSLTKELVSLMNGDIQVESVEGQGSVFTVLLPITHDAPVKVATVQPTAVAHIAPIPKVESSSSLSTDERPSLLIIEDNADIVSYLYTTLEDHYVLYSASDGQAGIEFALEQVPDLIITDVMMPYKNGYEVCEILKLDPRTSHIPIVMLTAKADQESRLEGYKRGADAYLPKPFDQNELLIRIEKLLELRLTLQTRYQNIFQLSQNDDPLIQIEDEFITQARKLILANLDNNKYRGEALGRDLAMSRTNIHRKIKALTGLSTSHFIRNIKIDHAKELLTTSSMQVAEVAYAVGFNDPSYFSRIFSDRVGTTPGEWRMGGGKKETDNHYLE